MAMLKKRKINYESVILTLIKIKSYIIISKFNEKKKTQKQKL